MSIESLIETHPLRFVYESGGLDTITTTARSNILTGSGFSLLGANYIIKTVDDTGKIVYFAIKSVDSDNQMTAANNSTSDITAASFEYSLAAVGNLLSPYFLCDNTQKKVDLFQTEISALGSSATSVSSPVVFTRKTRFNLNEGVLVKSLYAKLPYQYTLADTALLLRLFYTLPSGAMSTIISNISEGSDSMIPLVAENVEIPIDAYVPPPPSTFIGSDWGIGVQVNCVRPSLQNALNENLLATISQIDAPDIMNGYILPVIIGARIQHTSPMT